MRDAELDASYCSNRKLSPFCDAIKNKEDLDDEEEKVATLTDAPSLTPVQAKIEQ